MLCIDGTNYNIYWWYKTGWPPSKIKIKNVAFIHLLKLYGVYLLYINSLTPNDPYSGRTAPPTSKRCNLYIYSTNIGTEYFKHGIYSLFFFLFKMQFVS